MGLGIDTGGTYTDAVVYDFVGRAVLAKNKALTTRIDLSLGIRAALAGLPADLLSMVERVSLSTTLATNACIEGKGAAAALFLLGYDPELLARLAPEYGLELDSSFILLPGRHGQHGEEQEEPDWEGLMAAAKAWRGRVEAFGVAEYWGVRNPAHEIRARQLIHEVTGLPVVCAHELSGELNSLRRAATTILNARLIPLTAELHAAVRSALSAHGVLAPLAIVRGDGSLMGEGYALRHPVETLLSGPAASILGGTVLAGEDKAIIVDMGGTTTDLAVILGGKAAAAPEGAEIGSWRTGTKAVEIHTAGLGADSILGMDYRGSLQAGPERAVPLAWLGWAYPGAVEEARALAARNHEVRFLLPSARRQPAGLSAAETAVLEALADQGPLSQEKMAEILETYPPLLPINRLLRLGLIERAALTPTDLLHLSGDFTAWSVPTAEAGARALAAKLGLTLSGLQASARELIQARLAGLIAKTIAAVEGKAPIDGELLEEALRPRRRHLAVALRTDLPLVGLGAPIGHFLPAAAAALGARAVIPPDAAVANAVGAIAGWIVVREEISILPHLLPSGDRGYSVHSPAAGELFMTLEEALAFARNHGEALTRETIRARGGTGHEEVEIEVEKEIAFAGHGQVQEIFLGATVICRGRARPGEKVT